MSNSLPAKQQTRPVYHMSEQSMQNERTMHGENQMVHEQTAKRRETLPMPNLLLRGNHQETRPEQKAPINRRNRARPMQRRTQTRPSNKIKRRFPNLQSMPDPLVQRNQVLGDESRTGYKTGRQINLALPNMRVKGRTPQPTPK